MDQRKIVALSGSSKETAAYGEQIGQRLRYITNKDTMKSQNFGVAEIHYLPGWNNRRDQHAIAAVVTRIRRARRREPLVEKYIVRLQDGRFVDQDYRGPGLEAVVETQETQLDGLRQMHARPWSEVKAEIEENRAHPERAKPRPVREETMTLDEVAEELGIDETDPSEEDFLDFLDGRGLK